MLSLTVALRFLKSGKAQTLLIIIGIAVAISIQIFVGLLIDSLQKSLVDKTIGNSPHVTITSSDDIATIRDWENIVQKIDRTSYSLAITPSASANALIKKGNDEYPVVMRGFNLENADKIYHINEAIYKGRPIRSQRDVLIGRDLAEELDATVGDELLLTTSTGIVSKLTITGLYDLGVATINKAWIVGHLDTVQKIFGFGNRVTSIEMSVGDVFQVDMIAGDIVNELDRENITIEHWKQQNQDLLSALEGQRISSTIIQSVIIVSVVIAISSILAISVLQKSREIGILKAMGIKDIQASFIFIYQGFFIGLISSVIGIVLGLTLLYAFNTFTSNPDGSSLIALYIDYNFIVRSWFIAIVASTLAGIIPARKALRVSPIDVIREG